MMYIAGVQHHVLNGLSFPSSSTDLQSNTGVVSGVVQTLGHRLTDSVMHHAGGSRDGPKDRYFNSFIHSFTGI